ncbi:MAG: hypothetical protein AAGA23_12680 [Pseudomonadota bacterium]
MQYLSRALIASFLADAIQASHAEELALRDGLLADLEAGTIVLMLPAGGIEQVDITTGNSLWTSEAADRPLIIDAGALVAQVDTAQPGRMDVAAISLNDGTTLQSYSVELPEDVAPLIDDSLGRQFKIRGLGSNAFAWQHVKKVVQGATLRDAPAPKRHEGAMGLDGSRLKAVDLPTGDAKANLWRAADTSPVVKIPDVKGRQFRSLSGEYTLVTERTRPESAQPYRWQVYAPDGSLRGSFFSAISYTPFVVLEGIVLQVTQPNTQRQEDGSLKREGLTLRAYDLESGSVVWCREIRDTRYRGPMPP